MYTNSQNKLAKIQSYAVCTTSIKMSSSQLKTRRVSSAVTLYALLCHRAVACTNPVRE